MKDKKIPDIILEQYVLNELNTIEREKIENLLETSPKMRARLREIEDSNRAIFAQYPVDRTADQILNRIKKDKKSSRFSFFESKGFMGSAIAFSFLILFTFFGTGIIESNSKNNSIDAGGFSDDTVRLKGDSALIIHRMEQNTPVQLSSGIVAHRGDRLQISYRSAKDFGVIISIDGRGSVTLHHPERADLSTKVEKGKVTALSRSYTLDDAPDFEQFYFITSNSVLDVNKIISTAKKLDDPEQNRLALEDGTSQQLFLLLKK